MKSSLFYKRQRLWYWNTIVMIVAMALPVPRLMGESDESETDEPGIEEIITTAPKPLSPRESAVIPASLKKERQTAPATAHPRPTATPAPAPKNAEGPKGTVEADEENETNEADNGPASAPLPPLPEQSASSGAPPNARPATSTGRPLPFRSVIHAVDPSAPLFTMGKKKIRIVHVTTATRFTRVDGKPATFEALEPGLEVRGSARKLAQSEWEAISVKIGSKAAAETATLDE